MRWNPWHPLLVPIPVSEEGTYYFERHSLTLKGVDAAIFAVFRALGLTVHIKPYDWRVETATVSTRRRQILLSPEATAAGDLAMHKKELERFGRGGYVGDEIFNKANWLNEMPREMSVGAGYLAGAKPTRRLGNEAEVEWDCSFLALFVVVPAFSDRILEAQLLSYHSVRLKMSQMLPFEGENMNE